MLIFRFFFIIIFSFNFSFADIKTKLFQLYKEKEYETVCDKGFTLFRKHRKDEVFISLYAHACLNSDLIDRLATPIVMLKRSKGARANAAYFSVILMKKKLLYQALLDNHDLTGIKLPSSSYVLSKVFDLFVENKKRALDGVYTLTDPTSKTTKYNLYIDKNKPVAQMIIEIYKDNKLIKRHSYW